MILRESTQALEMIGADSCRGLCNRRRKLLTNALIDGHLHEAGTLLKADFLFSPDAQTLSDPEHGNPLKPTSYKLWYPEAGMSMAQYDKAMEQWEKLLREIGRK